MISIRKYFAQLRKLFIPGVLVMFFAALSVAEGAGTDEKAAMGELVEFISCPIYRDARAGRKSGCWLADDAYSGIRYDITTSPTKPDWNYKVLVEGRVTEKTQLLTETPCGGVVLTPVRVSVLPETCPRHMLPAEGFPGRPYSLPERNVKPLSIPRQIPLKPFQSKSFYLFFDFNKDFIIYQFGDYFLDKVISWIRAAQPKKLIITGYAATQGLTVSGQPMSEAPELARMRAQKVEEALIRLGVDPKMIELHWETKPDAIEVEGVDGLPGSSLRRAEISAVL